LDSIFREPEKTAEIFKSLNQECEFAFKSMWLINNDLGQIFKQRGKQLTSQQTFVSIFFKRNIVYLHSAHILASIGFIDPCTSLLRTIYETILKGYLFIIKNEEAEEYYKVIGTENEEKYQNKRGASYLRRELYTPEAQEKHRLLYKELCIPAHANIKGAGLDFPRYAEKRVEDNLKVILSLSYGNIQMMAEEFITFLSPNLKRVIVITLESLAKSLGSIILLEPNKKEYSTNIILKQGNFYSILQG